MNNRIIVAAVITDGQAICAAQRAYPPELAGMWEFPGGKAEAGEKYQEALARELKEELGWVGSANQIGALIVNPQQPHTGLWPILAGREMALFWIKVTNRESIKALEHQQLLWLSPTEEPGWLTKIPWLPADLPIAEYLEKEIRKQNSLPTCPDLET